MLHVHTIGRIGKDCQVIAGAHGSFMAMNIAVDDYAKGQNVTTWVKVRSSKENHIRLAEYLTKGRLVLVEGTLSSSLWTDKTGRARFSFPLRRRASHSSIQARRTARLAARTTWRPQRTTHPYPLPICRRTTRTTCRSDKGITGDGMDWTMVYAVSGSQGNRPAAGMVYAGFSLHHRQK